MGHKINLRNYFLHKLSYTPWKYIIREQLDFISDNSMDVVFVSNFFEHIPDKDDILKILQECKRILVRG